MAQMLTNEEPRHIKIQIYHELIGSHSFDFTDKNHMSELRLHITENSPLYIYENFHFQLDANRLYQYNELSDIFKADARLTVVFDPYDHYSSRYHEMKVREILQDPIRWAVVNSKEIGFNLLEDETDDYPAYQIDKLFDNPFSSPFLLSRERRESEFGGMLNVSGFNPPPYFRKMQGDLYYLHVRTLEQTDFHITANSEGFFVNQSTQGSFNPNHNPKFSLCISLIDLLWQLSPKFKMQFQEIQRTAKVTEFQKILHNFKPILENWQWLKENNGWRKSNIWRNDGYHEMQKHDFSVVKDWVEIFQFQRSTPGDSLYDKLGKQKIKYKLYQQFIDCAQEGVTKIFKGSLQPINTAIRFQHQVFYYSYLLFYFAAEHSDLPTPTQANRELINLSNVQPLDTDGVCLSHMVVVNYRGYKVIVRTIPSSLVNGHSSFASAKELFENNNHLQTDETLSVVLKKICRQLGVESQCNIVNEQAKSTSFIGHPDIKGCVTKDKKRFIFDLMRLSCRDFNFTGPESDQCLLRPQIMRIYNNKQKCHTLFNTIIGTKHKLATSENTRQQQKKLHSIAKFAKQIMIPLFIDSFDGEMRKYLSDSKGILLNLHKHGLSSKYLGMIFTKASQKHSSHVVIMIERVILVKSLKHLFNKALKEVPIHLHKPLLKHLLTIVFAQSGNQNGHHHKDGKNEEDQDSNNVKKGKKKKIKQSQSFMEINFSKSSERYLTIRQEEFWEEVKTTAFTKFKHHLRDKKTFFELQFSKTAILRDLCLCLGLQLERKDYFSDHGNFNEEHILGMVPRVKLIISQPRELSDLIEQGDKLAAKYQIEEAFDAYNRALQYIFSSFGGVHEKLALINKKIASIYFKIGDPQTAVIFALNSCEIYQNLLGEEHVETIQAYMMVGVYNYARKRFAASEYYILKAIFLAKFAYSECYPEVLVMHLNLSTIYQTQRKFPDAIMCLYLALNISIQVYGELHIHTAIVFSALASLHYEIPDIEQAIKFQQKSITILEQLLGSDDERVVEAQKTCQGYKLIQNSRKIRQIHQKQQKNLLGMQSNGKVNFKMPFYDFREKPAELFWKKGRKMKYFL